MGLIVIVFQDPEEAGKQTNKRSNSLRNRFKRQDSDGSGPVLISMLLMCSSLDVKAQLVNPTNGQFNSLEQVQICYGSTDVALRLLKNWVGYALNILVSNNGLIAKQSSASCNRCMPRETLKIPFLSKPENRS